MPQTRPDAPRPLHPLNAWIRFTLGFLLLVVLSPPTLLAALLFLPSRRIRVRIGNLYGKTIGYGATRLAGTRPIVHHAERLDPSRPALYIANHASVLDVFVGMWLCPVGGVGAAKKEMGLVPLFGWTYAATGHLLLDRGNRTSAIAALDKVAALIKRHRMGVWIWPEGTRSRDGRLQRFKKGFAHMALSTRLPIVPVIIHDAHQRWPNRTFLLCPGDLHIDVLEPIDTSGWTLERLDHHINEVHEVFVANLGPNQRPLEVVEAAS